MLCRYIMTKMDRYNNSKIYKLMDNEGYFYIGSTCCPLYKRLSHHKSDAEKRNTKVYARFNKVGWENVKIVLIEEHYLENVEQLKREEDKVIQMFINDDKCLNMNRASRSKEEACEYKRNHYQQNKEHYITINKMYHENNRDKILQQRKEYYELNKETILLKQKEYCKNKYQQNREFHLSLVTCSCGSSVTHANLKRHEKSKCHINFINGLKIEAESI